jgi:hypothetical protein
VRWLVISLVVGGLAAAAAFLRSRFGASRPDVGAVSDQWIAEHHSDRSQQ